MAPDALAPHVPQTPSVLASRKQHRTEESGRESLTTSTLWRPEPPGRVQPVPIVVFPLPPQGSSELTNGFVKSAGKHKAGSRKEAARSRVTGFEVPQLGGKAVAGDGELSQLQLVQPVDLLLVLRPVVDDVLG